MTDNEKIVTWLPGNDRLLAYDEDGRAVVLTDEMVETIAKFSLPYTARAELIEDEWGDVLVEITPPGVRVLLAHPDEVDGLVETLGKIAGQPHEMFPRVGKGKVARYRLLDELCKVFDVQRLGQVAMNVLGYTNPQLYQDAKDALVDVWLDSEKLDQFFEWLRSQTGDSV
jgi:hypothetical protein